MTHQLLAGWFRHHLPGPILAHPLGSVPALKPQDRTLPGPPALDDCHQGCSTPLAIASSLPRLLQPLLQHPSFPRTPAGAPLTREEDVVELVLQQPPRLLGPAQHHGKAALQGGGRDARLRGPCRISGDPAGSPTGGSGGVGHRLTLTWSRYRGSTLARTFIMLLLISEGFSTTQLPVGRGGAGRGRGHV